MKKWQIYGLIGIGAIILIAIIWTVFKSQTFQTKVLAKPTPDKVSNNIASNLFIASDNSFIRFLDPSQAKFFEINLASNEQKEISETLPFIKNVSYSSDGNQVVLQSTNTMPAITANPLYNTDVADGSNTYSLYDFGKKNISQYPANFKNVIFATGQNRIVYNYQKSTENNFSSANPDQSDYKKLIDSPQKDVTTISYLLNDQKIIYKNNPDSIIYSAYITDKKISEVATAANALVSPDGQKIIYENSSKIYLANIDGSGKTDLDLSTSLDKINWTTDNKIIAAITQTKVDILPAELQTQADTINVPANAKSDKLYLIDPATTQKTEIEFYSKNPIVNIANLHLSNNILFFTSNNYLYKMALK